MESPVMTKQEAKEILLDLLNAILANLQTGYSYSDYHTREAINVLFPDKTPTGEV